MSFRSLGILAIVMLGLAAVSQTVAVQPTDPQVVLQRYIEAQNAGNVDTALPLWVEDGVMTNTRGRKVTGQENLRRFIRGNVARNIRQEPEFIETPGDKVTWINRESNDPYRKLKVAPVQQNSEIIVRDGKIISWVNYFPVGEIARSEQACTTPEGQGVLLNDQPCSQFIELAKAQTANVTGSKLSDIP
jgi:limonene-1,2-epoxide hydrolase